MVKPISGKTVNTRVSLIFGDIYFPSSRNGVLLQIQTGAGQSALYALNITWNLLLADMYIILVASLIYFIELHFILLL